MSNSSSYYYSSLSKIQQKTYYAIMEGLLSMAPSFPVPHLTDQELSDIYFMVRMDHPEIFYSVTFKYRYYQQADNIDMIPSYIFPRAKIKEHQQALQARIKKLARQAEKLDEKGKEQFIHDFVCRNIHYDKLKKPYSHEIIGALGQGVAVCEDIAKAVKILCDELGLWCIIALSGNNPEKGIKYRHTWNIIRIGKSYYHLDATFDNSLTNGSTQKAQTEKQPENSQPSENLIDVSSLKKKKGSPSPAKEEEKPIRYDYFNLDDTRFFRDHEQLIWSVPACTDNAHSYYQENKQSLTKYEDVRKKAAQAVKKGIPFIFHWRGGYLTKEVLSELLQILKEEADKQHKYVCLSLNWPQAVLSVSFRAELPASEILMEDANEDEQYEEPAEAQERA